jgi:hypothetical protein
MTVTVVTPATRKRLTTVDAVLRAMRTLAPQPTDQESMVLISDLIDRASDAIVTHCDRPFALQTYQETVSGYGTSRIMLSVTPVVSVTSILDFSNSPVVDFNLEDPETGVLYRRIGWNWLTSIGWDRTMYVIPRGEDPNYVAVYAAGYFVPDTGFSTLPGDVEQACIETVIAWYQAQSRDPNIISKRTRDTMITYRTSTGVEISLPPHAVGLLIPFQRAV